jgi:acyl carrier protein
MLTLYEATRISLLRYGQFSTLPQCQNLDYEKIEQLFLSALYEYLDYVPIPKEGVYHLTPQGLNMNGIMREVSYIKFDSFAREYNDRLDGESWEFDTNKNLSCVLSGNFYVKYFAEPDIGNLDFNYLERTIVPKEDKIKFILKGHFQKGSLKINLVDNLNIYEMTEKISSYTFFETTITSIDLVNNIISVPSELGKKIKHLSLLKFSTTGTLPNPLLANTEYYVIKLSDTDFYLATNIINANNEVVIDITNVGTGTHTVIIPNDTEHLSDDTEILLEGSLGTGTVNLLTLEVNIKINAVLNPIVKKSVNVFFTSYYQAVRDFSIKEILFLKLFAGYLIRAMGINKDLMKNNLLPFDPSADNLADRGQSLIDNTIEEIKERKGLEII